MRLLTIGEAGVEVEVEPYMEDEEPEQWDFEDDDHFRRRKHAYNQMLPLNPWPWCQIRVRASWNGLHGDVWYGECSYADKTEFLLTDAFTELADEALDELNERVAALQRPCCDCECENTAS